MSLKFWQYLIIYSSLAVSAVSFLRRDIYLTGRLALIVLTLVIFTKPLVRLFPTVGLFKLLLALRRQTGQASAIFALTHVATQVFSGAPLIVTFRTALENGPVNFQFWGFWAFILIIPLFLTANNFSTGLLKRNWFRLHKLIHPLYVFVLLHYTLQKGTRGLVFFVTVLVLLYASRFLVSRGVQFFTPAKSL